MRYIPLSDLKLPEGWAAKVESLKKKLETAGPEDRKKLIEDHAGLWRDLKQSLSDLSFGKCWYCETREMRSDRVVDHFRPKKRVEENKDHSGYWWLAFECSNYRFSCTFCNSLRKSEDEAPAGGKADHFPILDERKRAYGPGDPIEDEFPILLDPASYSDPLLLGFHEDGSAVPKSSDTSSIHFQRALKSIHLLHLNHPDIREARLMICKEITELVNEGNRAYLRQDQGMDAALPARDGFESILRRLRDMVAKTAQYSRAARAALSAHRTHPWVSSVLEDSG